MYDFKPYIFDVGDFWVLAKHKAFDMLAPFNRCFGLYLLLFREYVKPRNTPTAWLFTEAAMPDL